MHRRKSPLPAALFIAASAFAVPAMAQETTLCTAMVYNGSPTPANATVVVSQTFPTSIAADYLAQWEAYIDSQYGSYGQRMKFCATPGTPTSAAEGRTGMITKYGVFTMMTPDWRPKGAPGVDTADANVGAQDKEEGSDPVQEQSESKTGVETTRRADTTAQNDRGSSRPGPSREIDEGRPLCALPPVDTPNTAFPSGSAVKFTNNCSRALKVRICLQVEGRWDCGATFGVEPGRDWSWGSTKRYTRVFYDARNADSKASMATPEN